MYNKFTIFNSKRMENVENLKHFLCICKDRKNDPDGFCYTVFFVNQSKVEITNLQYETWGYMTDEGTLVETTHFNKYVGNVPANSFIAIENDDEDSFEFTIHFLFDITFAAGNTQKITFTIDKYLKNGVKFSHIPILNKSGIVFKGS